MSFKNKTLNELLVKFTAGSLLSTNKKMEKGNAQGWTTTGLQLLPEKKGGGKNVCPSATAECVATCLVFSGNARFTPTMQARYDRTRLYNLSRKYLVELVKAELIKLNVLAASSDLNVAVRLNVFSDLPWEKFIDMESFPNIQFYDYTKIYKRMCKFLTNEMPSNYHLTFSYSGRNAFECDNVLAAGGNVAMVFDEVPDKWDGYNVINGDETDLTFLYPKGNIIGLKFKKVTIKGTKANDISDSIFVVKTNVPAA